MRIIDLHCYPNTQPWIDCQGPYVKALAEYWDRHWTAKEEDEVLQDFTGAGVEAVLRALAEEEGLKAGAIIHPFRVAITGRAVSADIFKTCEILGPERVLGRLKAAAWRA